MTSIEIFDLHEVKIFGLREVKIKKFYEKFEKKTTTTTITYTYIPQREKRRGIFVFTTTALLYPAIIQHYYNDVCVLQGDLMQTVFF